MVATSFVEQHADTARFEVTWLGLNRPSRAESGQLQSRTSFSLIWGSYPLVGAALRRQYGAVAVVPFAGR